MIIPVGAHIRVWRAVYWHHGVHVGGGVVVHYSGLTKTKATATIRKTTLAEFAAHCRIHIVEYAAAPDPRAIVLRATSRLGENGYHLFGNNCEHFARWCVTGQHLSSQVDNLAAGTIGVGGGAAATAGSVGAVVSAGELAGLAGGASVMRGLAAAGGAIGTGAAGGLALLTVAPAAATTIAVHKVFKDDDKLPMQERKARQTARRTATTTAMIGAGSSIALVSAVGIPGLSAAGITTGLAGIGAAFGGGMLAGVAAVVALPAVLAGLLGVAAYKLTR